MRPSFGLVWPVVPHLLHVRLLFNFFFSLFLCFAFLYNFIFALSHVLKQNWYGLFVTQPQFYIDRASVQSETVAAGATVPIGHGLCFIWLHRIVCSCCFTLFYSRIHIHNSHIHTYIHERTQKYAHMNTDTHKYTCIVYTPERTAKKGYRRAFRLVSLTYRHVHRALDSWNGIAIVCCSARCAFSCVIIQRVIYVLHTHIHASEHSLQLQSVQFFLFVFQQGSCAHTSSPVRCIFHLNMMFHLLILELERLESRIRAMARERTDERTGNRERTKLLK